MQLNHVQCLVHVYGSVLFFMGINLGDVPLSGWRRSRLVYVGSLDMVLLRAVASCCSWLRLFGLGVYLGSTSLTRVFSYVLSSGGFVRSGKFVTTISGSDGS